MSETGYIYREHKSAAAGAPTLFVFHGTGGDENQFFELGRQLMPQARVIAPRGDVSEGGALRYFRRTGEGVYDMEDLALRTRKLADFVRGVAPDGPIVGMGYSNGANILASVMLAHPELFSAAALMHPLIPWTPADEPGLAGRKVLITAGERDPICPPAQTRALAEYFMRQGAGVDTFWHPGGHEIVQAELLGLRGFFGRI